MQNTLAQIVNNHNAEVFKRQFINHVPIRCSIAVALKLPARTRSYCIDMDQIEFHYRRYVSGQSITIARVNTEIRAYLTNGHYPKGIIELIDDLEEPVLAAEFYELMSRVKSSRMKIEKLIRDFYIHPSSK
jgi:hypothetical protein